MSIDSVSDLSSPAPSHPDPSPRAQMSTPVSQQQQTNSSQTQQTQQQPLATSISQVAQNAVVATISTTQDGISKELPPQTDQQSKNVDEDSRPPQASPTLSR